VTPEQLQLLRDTVALDKGNAICIAILNLLDLVDKQENQINDLLDELWALKASQS